MKQLVVVGTQHGGAWIASRLKKVFRSAAHVTLIVPRPEEPILPVLTHQIADVLDQPLLKLRHELEHLGIKVIVSKVTAHDPQKKVLYIDHGRLEYDVLIEDPLMCVDTTPVHGAYEYAFSLDSLRNADNLLGHLDAQFTRASHLHEDDQDGFRTVVIARGDAQGVEAAFAIAHRLHNADYGVRPRIILCAPELLAAHDEADEMLRAHLMDAGVRTVPMSVERILPNSVRLADDTDTSVIDCNTVVLTGHWKSLPSRVCSGDGVLKLDVGAPYWPITDVEMAHDAVRWVSSYLSGNPELPKAKREHTLLKTPGGVLFVGKRVEKGLHHGWRHAWHLKSKLDL